MTPDNVVTTVMRGLELVKRSEFAIVEPSTRALSEKIVAGKQLSKNEMTVVQRLAASNNRIERLCVGGNEGAQWASGLLNTTPDFERLAKEHNERNSAASQRTTAKALKEVHARARNAGASDTMQRLNAFMKLLRAGSPGNPEYTADNDLLPAAHKRYSGASSTGDVTVSKVDGELGIVFG